MVVPKLASEVLRRSFPRTERKQAEISDNRSFAQIVSNPQKSVPILTEAQDVSLEVVMRKIREAKEHADNNLELCNPDDHFTDVLQNLADAVALLMLSQETMYNALHEQRKSCIASAEDQRKNDQSAEDSNKTKQPRIEPTFTTIGTFPPPQANTAANLRAARPVLAPSIIVHDSADHFYESFYDSEPSDEEKRKAKFRKAVEEAERSTLVLNLNLGKVRMVNPETISSNVTKALSEMAARKENPNSTVPSAAAVEALDDIISVTKTMSFYGKTTKSVRNTKNRELNGSYCTVPVKYEFRDRGTKFYADEVFRELCGAQVSVPYPTILREAVRQIVEEGKKEYPTYLIKVLVDTRKMVFKISRREKKNSEWVKFPRHIPIPSECLDVDSRIIPDGFRIQWPKEQERTSRKDSAEKSPGKNRADATDPGGSQNTNPSADTGTEDMEHSPGHTGEKQPP